MHTQTNVYARWSFKSSRIWNKVWRAHRTGVRQRTISRKTNAANDSSGALARASYTYTDRIDLRMALANQYLHRRRHDTTFLFFFFFFLFFNIFFVASLAAYTAIDDTQNNNIIKSLAYSAFGPIVLAFNKCWWDRRMTKRKQDA